MMSFVSLNSWNEPGAILQATEPEEIVAGGPDDWGKLREVLARRRKTGRDSVHPQSAAVGYITYEGTFRFAWFPKIALLAENGFSALWDGRRAEVDKKAADDREVVPPSWQANQTRVEFEARVARAQE